MNNQLLILPFDHRNSFKRDLLGKTDGLNTKEISQVKNLKQIIFDGFLGVFNRQKLDDNLGILVDEEFGAKILKQARKHRAVVCLSVEKSGEKEFKFEYSNSFGEHIQKFKPDYVKALVRYNPLNKEINQRQLLRLQKLNSFCQKNNYFLMIELLVPPTEYDFKKAKSLEIYDNKFRVKRTVGAIKEIKRQIKVDVWKLEDFDSAGWKKVIRATGRSAKIICLGGGESKKAVSESLLVASKFSQVIGFAIGRTIFLQTLKDFQHQKITQEQAVKRITANYGYFVKVWRKFKHY